MFFYTFEWAFFVVALVIAGGLQWYVRRGSHSAIVSQEFKRFQWLWLAVYYVVMFSDWMQGPYVYALYENYGMRKEQIAYLFVAGFASSAIFGTFVGSLADKYGRRRLSVAFGVFYSISCMLKISTSFAVLLIGRLLSGIATSLLFSVFEAWMVSEHIAESYIEDKTSGKVQFQLELSKAQRGYDPAWLADTFSIAIFGNGVVAIVAGIVSSMVSIEFGFVAPFMVAMVFLIGSAIFVSWNWNENFGDSKMEISNVFSGGIGAIQKDIRVLLLGSMQSLFEGSMYVFVFMWTPLLTEAVPEFSDAKLGLHGLTFASFMVSIMVGSAVYALVRDRYSPEFLYTLMLGVASATFFLISISSNGYFIFFLFMIFEVCCGLHFTLIGMLRGKYTFIILFLCSLILSIYLVEQFQSHTVFLICTFWLALGGAVSYRLSSSSIASLSSTPSEQSASLQQHEPEGNKEKTNGNY